MTNLNNIIHPVTYPDNVKQRPRLQRAREASSACVKDADHSVVAASAHPLSGLPSSRQNGDSFAGRLIVDAFDVIDASQRPPANHAISASHDNDWNQGRRRRSRSDWNVKDAHDRDRPPHLHHVAGRWQLLEHQRWRCPPHSNPSGSVRGLMSSSGKSLMEKLRRRNAAKRDDAVFANGCTAPCMLCEFSTAISAAFAALRTMRSSPPCRPVMPASSTSARPSSLFSFARRSAGWLLR
jgi:hypothetical protein